MKNRISVNLYLRKIDRKTSFGGTEGAAVDIS